MSEQAKLTAIALPGRAETTTQNAVAKQAAPLTRLTSPQKAALVIAALGPESAGPIIERVDDKHLRAFARAYANLQSVPKEILKGVVEEFVASFATDDQTIKGGFEETRELLRQFVSSDAIIRLMEDIDGPGGQTVWEKLERADEAALAEYLQTQRPQLIAIVLSKINTEHASKVLDQLDADLVEKVIMRLSKPLQVTREVVQVISDTIERDFLAPMKSSSKRRNPGEMIGSMMNNIISEKRDKILEFISSEVPDILVDVRKSMLTFQDLADRVPPNAMSSILKEVETDTFLQAAKFGKQNAPSSVEFIFGNISQRMAQQYEEQMEKLKNIPIKEAEGAQAEFMSVVRRLVAMGEFELIEIVSEDEQEE